MTAVLLGLSLAFVVQSIAMARQCRRHKVDLDRKERSLRFLRDKCAAVNAVSLDVFGYCYRCEGVVMNIAHPKHGQSPSIYMPLAREVVDSRPSVVPLMAAIDAGNWAEVERIRHEGPKPS